MKFVEHLKESQDKVGLPEVVPANKLKGQHEKVLLQQLEVCNLKLSIMYSNNVRVIFYSLGR